jgi:hypothetical protein
MAEDTMMAEDTIQVLASTPPTLGTGSEATFEFVAPSKGPYCGANSGLGPTRGKRRRTSKARDLEAPDTLEAIQMAMTRILEGKRGYADAIEAMMKPLLGTVATVISERVEAAVKELSERITALEVAVQKRDHEQAGDIADRLAKVEKTLRAGNKKTGQADPRVAPSPSPQRAPRHPTPSQQIAAEIAATPLARAEGPARFQKEDRQPTYASILTRATQAKETAQPPTPGTDGWSTKKGRKTTQRERKAARDVLSPVNAKANKLENRRVILLRDRKTPVTSNDTTRVRNLILAVNTALKECGAPEHVRIYSAASSQRGNWSVLTYPSATAEMLLLYKDAALIAARRVDDGIIDIQPNVTWSALKVHHVPKDRYLTMDRLSDGLQTLKRDIEAENAFEIQQVRWLKSVKHWNGPTVDEKRATTAVIIVKDPQTAHKLVNGGIRFGGRLHAVERYIEVTADTFCTACCGWGHAAYSCTSPIRCFYCGGPHSRNDHRCNIRGCEAVGKDCHHTRALARCAGCSGNHYAKHRQCPARKVAENKARAESRNAKAGANTAAQPEAAPAQADDALSDEMDSTMCSPSTPEDQEMAEASHGSR